MCFNETSKVYKCFKETTHEFKHIEGQSTKAEPQPVDRLRINRLWSTDYGILDETVDRLGSIG